MIWYCWQRQLPQADWLTGKSPCHTSKPQGLCCRLGSTTHHLSPVKDLNEMIAQTQCSQAFCHFCATGTNEARLDLDHTKPVIKELILKVFPQKLNLPEIFLCKNSLLIFYSREFEVHAISAKRTHLFFTK